VLVLVAPPAARASAADTAAKTLTITRRFIVASPTWTRMGGDGIEPPTSSV
jgi:hypothetical protein